VQLYFVQGWNVAAMGRRYERAPAHARYILAMWKSWAVKALCIQYIPPVEATVQQRSARISPGDFMRIPRMADPERGIRASSLNPG
jgi:hypothetical protein